MSTVTDLRSSRFGGRVAYSRKDPVWDEEHRRALDEVLRLDKKAAGAETPQQPDDASPSLAVPVPVPAVTFLAEDGSKVACLAASSTGVCDRATRSESSTAGGTRHRRQSKPRIPAPPASSRRASEKDRSEQQPLSFSAAFESGNLFSAKLVRIEEPDGATSLPHYEYELHLDNDSNSYREHTQWFHFAVFNLIPCVATFRIVNFRKKGSLHRVGMQPHVRAASSGFSDWDATCCTEVGYTANPRGTDGGLHRHAPQHYTLTFRYDFTTAQDTVFFAGQTPYTLTMLRALLAKLGSNPSTRMHFTEQELCVSSGGLQVPVLMITAGLPEICVGRSKSSQPAALRRRALGEVRRKPAVVVIARQHPGETVGSYVVAGLIRFLLGSSPDAEALREKFCFHIVPMVNVDGVVNGNSRCTLNGLDPNRCWLNPVKELHPEVYALREYISRTRQAAGVQLFLDLHGHSQRVGSFFYGNCPQQIRSALFPKLASLGTRDVDFDGSRWRFAKAHNQSARAVVFNHCHVFNSFTVETSSFAQKLPASPSQPQSRGSEEARLRRIKEVLFMPRRVESIGCALGWAMVVFFGLELKVRSAATELAELQTSPWLSHAQLRCVAAEGVLQELQAAGQTVFDLKGTGEEGEDDAGSDSDGGLDEDERDEDQAAGFGEEGPPWDSSPRVAKAPDAASITSGLQASDCSAPVVHSNSGKAAHANLSASRTQQTSNWMKTRSCHVKIQKMNSVGVTQFSFPKESGSASARASQESSPRAPLGAFGGMAPQGPLLDRCGHMMAEGGEAPGWLSARAARAPQPPPASLPPTILTASGLFRKPEWSQPSTGGGSGWLSDIIADDLAADQRMSLEERSPRMSSPPTPRDVSPSSAPARLAPCPARLRGYGDHRREGDLLVEVALGRFRGRATNFRTNFRNAGFSLPRISHAHA